MRVKHTQTHTTLSLLLLLLLLFHLPFLCTLVIPCNPSRASHLTDPSFPLPPLSFPPPPPFPSRSSQRPGAALTQEPIRSSQTCSSCIQRRLTSIYHPYHRRHDRALLVSPIDAATCCMLRKSRFGNAAASRGIRNPAAASPWQLRDRACNRRGCALGPRRNGVMEGHDAVDPHASGRQRATRQRRGSGGFVFCLSNWISLPSFLSLSLSLSSIPDPLRSLPVPQVTASTHATDTYGHTYTCPSSRVCGVVAIFGQLWRTSWQVVVRVCGSTLVCLPAIRGQRPGWQRPSRPARGHELGPSGR